MLILFVLKENMCFYINFAIKKFIKMYLFVLRKRKKEEILSIRENFQVEKFNLLFF